MNDIEYKVDQAHHWFIIRQAVVPFWRRFFRWFGVPQTVEYRTLRRDKDCLMPVYTVNGDGEPLCFNTRTEAELQIASWEAARKEKALKASIP